MTFKQLACSKYSKFFRLNDLNDKEMTTYKIYTIFAKFGNNLRIEVENKLVIYLIPN